MVFNIILNSSNVVGSTNTAYVKSFIGGSLTIPQGSEMCISQIVIPYSWYNITKNYNNNSFSYIWNGYYPNVIWNGTSTSGNATLASASADSGSSGSFGSGQLVVGSYLPAGTTYVSGTSNSITVSNNFTTSGTTVISGIPTFTGYVTMTTISGVSTPILTLSSIVNSATFALNTVLYSGDANLKSNVYVKSLYSGTLGAVGSSYILANQTVNVGSVGSPFKFGFIGTYNTITIPDGFYTVSDLNNYIQSYMISLNQYLYNSTLLQNQYFAYLYSNSTYYANQFILQGIPSSFTQYSTANPSSTYTLPTGFPFSALGYTPQISVVDFMSDYLGLLPAIYPSAPSSSSQSVISNYAPTGSYVNSVVVRCNLVNNNATSPTDVIDTFYPNTTFGGNIVYEPPYEKWVDIIEGTYNNLYIYFQDQDGNTIFARDNNVLISLLLKIPNYEPVVQTIQTIVQPIQPLDFKE